MKISRSKFQSADSSSSILLNFRFKFSPIGVDDDAISWLTALESIPLVVQSLWLLQDSPLPLLAKSEDFLDQNKCKELYGFHIHQPFLRYKGENGSWIATKYIIWSILVKISTWQSEEVSLIHFHRKVIASFFLKFTCQNGYKK